jgi:hypothetical protein
VLVLLRNRNGYDEDNSGLCYGMYFAIADLELQNQFAANRSTEMGMFMMLDDSSLCVWPS